MIWIFIYGGLLISLLIYIIYFFSTSRYTIFRNLYNWTLGLFLKKTAVLLAKVSNPIADKIKPYIKLKHINLIAHMYTILMGLSVVGTTYKLAYEGHKMVGIPLLALIYFLFGLTNYFYLMTAYIDPGYVIAENVSAYVELHKKYYDGAVYIAKTNCNTCKIIK